jgi:hypothetical protein
MDMFIAFGHGDSIPVRGHDFDRHKTACRDPNLPSRLVAEKYSIAELCGHVACGRVWTSLDE